MNVNKWTLGLAAVGLVTLPGAVAQAEEAHEHLLTGLSSTTISGLVDTSAQWNLGTGNTGLPGYPMGGAGKADGFNLNLVKVSLEKPLDSADSWAAGYKVDLAWGADMANGYGIGTSSSSDNAGGGIKQAYVALRMPVGNGLDWKLGVFDTIIGYETFERVNNPNYTHSYAWGIEPTSHTGALASYQVNESVGIAAGAANTWGPLINGRSHNALGLGQEKAESYKTYMASLTLTAPESMGFLAGSALYAGVVNGFDNTADYIPGGATQGANRANYYVGVTLKTPVKGLKVGASYDYSGVKEQKNIVSGAGRVNAVYANATTLYLSFQATEKLSLHTRGEYFTQSDSTVNPRAVAGLPTRVLGVTETLQYDLWKNVISRLEFRWDHQADGTGRTYDSGTKRNAYLVAANVIYKF